MGCSVAGLAWLLSSAAISIVWLIYLGARMRHVSRRLDELDEILAATARDGAELLQRLRSQRRM